MWHAAMFEELEKSKDETKAAYMTKYMKNKFTFLGVPTPIRKSISSAYFKQLTSEKLDCYFVDTCYESIYREHQYVAVDYLQTFWDKLKNTDIKLIERLITTKSWWDTVDGLDKVAGLMAEKNPVLNKKIIAWSKADNIWLRRAAIDHQLYRKTKTDTRVLEILITNNFGSTEFFINKAIGWALREYSKTNPLWVKNFLDAHHNKMSRLSLREASKYID